MKKLLFFISLLAIGCGKMGSSNSESSTDNVISGRAMAGPIKSGTVTAYDVEDDGTRGESLGSTTTGDDGTYELELPNHDGPIELVVTGGSYLEEASGQTVSLTGRELTVFLDDVMENRAASITPLTEIAAKRARGLFMDGHPLGTAIGLAADEIEAAAGIADMYEMPANPEAPIADASSDAAKYAAFLAGISQMAEDKGIDSLDVTDAFLLDFQNDGTFDGDNDGTPIAIGGALLGADDWSTDLTGAMTDFINSPDNDAGFMVGYIPAPILDPGIYLPPPIYDPIAALPGATPMPATMIRIMGPPGVPVNMCMPMDVVSTDIYGIITPTGMTTMLSFLITPTPGADFYMDPACTIPVMGGVGFSGGGGWTPLFFKATSPGVYSVFINDTMTSLQSVPFVVDVF